MSELLWDSRLRRSWWLVALAFGASVLVLATNAILDSLHGEQLRQALLNLNGPPSARQLDELLGQQLLQRQSVRGAVLVLLVLLGLAVVATRRVVRAAQASLLDSGRQFQDMLDTLPQLVWLADAQGHSRYLNRRWTEYSGLPVADLLGEGWFKAVHPDDVAMATQVWRAAVASQLASTTQFRLLGRDGGYRWFSASFSVNRDAQSQSRQWLASAVDIEDVRQARLALERGEQLSRDTLNALSEGVITFDGSGPLKDCNASAERVLGVPRSVMVNQPIAAWGLTLRHEDGRPMALDETPVNTVFKTGQPCRDVLVHATAPGGQQRWLHVNAEPVHSAGSRTLVAVVASFNDVTERMQVRLELSRHRDQLEALVAERTEQLGDAERFTRLVADKVQGRIAYWDRELRCRFVNQTFCDYHGRPAEALLGLHIRELRGDTYFTQTLPRIEAVLAGQPQDFDRLDEDSRGQQAQMRVQYFPDRRDGEVKGFVALVSDISRHKQAEQLLRLANEQMAEARDRAQAANQAKSAFLANMSHEIRTPMNAIVGFTHVLRGELRGARQQQQLAHITAAADHLLQIINDLLDLSKIEAGKLALEPADFSLPELLESSCALVAQQAAGKGLALNVEARDLPQLLHGDATRLTQALLNLLSNAVKFTERGEVKLRVSVAEALQDQVVLLFEVADTGPGIAPAEFARLFNPFAQADSHSTRSHGGSGLGLAIARHIAQQMGGDAGGESQLGQGSSFWFTARLGLGARPFENPPLPQAPAVGRLALDGVRVLLVEDNPVNQEVASQLLRAAGAQVQLAGDGQQALEMLRLQEPDLVLMDVQMPRMDGLQATRLIRQDPALRHLPVVALTANALPQDRQACLDAGMNDYLAKPADPQQLYATLRRWLPRPPGAAPVAPQPAGDPQPPPSAQRQLEALEAWLDLEQAKAYCGDQSTVLLRIVAAYAQRYRDAPAELSSAMAAGDLPAASRVLHSLRGASAAVGAGALVDDIKQLEAAIAQGQGADEMAPAVQALGTRLQALVVGLARALAG